MLGGPGRILHYFWAPGPWVVVVYYIISGGRSYITLFLAAGGLVVQCIIPGADGLAAQCAAPALFGGCGTSVPVMRCYCYGAMLVIALATLLGFWFAGSPCI